MWAILTGDVINSRNVKPNEWLPKLKEALNRWGENPWTWEVFRGDSFQIAVNPQMAIEVALYIKSVMKEIDMDVRIGIGIGNIEYRGVKITESNGKAFLNSGAIFENLKSETLGFKSPWKNLDKTISVIFGLLEMVLNGWTDVSAKTLKLKFEKPGYNQQDLGYHLSKTQGNISRDLKRAGYNEIKKLMEWYSEECKNKMQNQ